MNLAENMESEEVGRTRVRKCWTDRGCEKRMENGCEREYVSVFVNESLCECVCECLTNWAQGYS